MKTVKRVIMVVVAIMLIAGVFAGCTDAEVAALNISKAANQFEIFRRVVFYNGITDTYILVIEGYCAVDIDEDGDFCVQVKTENGQFLEHYLGLSDNVTYFAEQLDVAKVSDRRYRVIFKPLEVSGRQE